MFVLIQCWLFLNYKRAHMRAAAEQIEKKNNKKKWKQKRNRDSVEFDKVAPSLLYFLCQFDGQQRSLHL